jgi:hypothetical protein
VQIRLCLWFKEPVQQLRMAVSPQSLCPVPHDPGDAPVEATSAHALSRSSRSRTQ